jgi:hypothetical protein
MNPTKLSLIVTAIGVSALSVFTSTQAQAVSLLGLTEDNTLVSFDSDSPSFTSSVRVTGSDLVGTLIGIDYRPANGQLYGVANDNNLFTINPQTGVATRVSTLDTPFTAGGFSGVDFNPAADRLRVNGTNEQNFRINVDNGATTVDGTLAYIASDPNAGTSPTITAAAYLNSFAGPPASVAPRTTQLFGIDSNLDVLALQNPPNEGGLATVGSLGVDFGSVGGFDISSPRDGVNTAYAAFGSPSDDTLAASLYSIDLNTGAATSLGQIGKGAGSNLIGLAAKPVPEPSSILGSLAVGALGTFSLLKRKQHHVKA